MSDIENIQQFLKGQLSGQELIAFEKKVQEDSEFREEVADYTVIFNGFEQLQQEAFKEKIQDWSKELPPLNTPPKRSFLSVSFIKKAAAALVILALSAFLYKALTGNNKLENFAKDNYIVLAVDADRSAKPESGPDQFKLAETSFKQPNYTAAIAQLKEIKAEDPLYLKALYLKEHALYQSKQYQETIQIFEQIKPIANLDQYKKRNFNKENAEWTSLLARLALFQKDSNPAQKAQLIEGIQTFLDQDPEEAYRVKAEALKSLLE